MTIETLNYEAKPAGPFLCWLRRRGASTNGFLATLAGSAILIHIGLTSALGIRNWLTDPTPSPAHGSILFVLGLICGVSCHACYFRRTYGFVMAAILTAGLSIYCWMNVDYPMPVLSSLWCFKCFAEIFIRPVPGHAAVCFARIRIIELDAMTTSPSANPDCCRSQRSESTLPRPKRRR